MKSSWLGRLYQTSQCSLQWELIRRRVHALSRRVVGTGGRLFWDLYAQVKLDPGFYSAFSKLSPPDSNTFSIATRIGLRVSIRLIRAVREQNKSQTQEKPTSLRRVTVGHMGCCLQLLCFGLFQPLLLSEETTEAHSPDPVPAFRRPPKKQCFGNCSLKSYSFWWFFSVSRVAKLIRSRRSSFTPRRFF